MADASWIYADLVGLIVGIICVALAGVFLDDFRKRFWWTKEHAYWTRTRLRLSSAGFLVADSCKSTISAWKKPRVIAALEIGGFRTHLAACFDRGRPTPRETALSFAPGIRRLGERFLPHAAVGSIHLKPAQQRAVSALTADPASELTRGEYEQLAGVSRSQAAYDLAELVEAGFLERIGKGRATRYRLAREGGTQRHWTSERIRTELQAFCNGRKVWPSAADFKEAGRSDLYIAASRYGGIGHWAEELGFPRLPRSAATAPEPSRFRTKLTWAGAGALAALALAAAGGAIVVTVTRQDATPSARPAHEAPAQQTPNPAVHPVLAQPSKTTHSAGRKVQRSRASVTARSRPAGSRSLPTRATTVQPRATSAAAYTRSFSAVTPTPSGGPAPLPAPSGSSPPNPLKAP